MSSAKNAEEFARELLDAWTLICSCDKGPQTWHCPSSTESSRQHRYIRGILRRVVNRISRYGNHPFADYLFETRDRSSMRDALENFDWKSAGVSK